MGLINDPSRPERAPSSETDFGRGARQRWEQLGEELRADVAKFNANEGSADFSKTRINRFRISNSRTGLELVVTADFDARTIRYDYTQMNDKSAGAPEGGILSMRPTKSGAVEFYSADQELTSEQTREILLEPVLFPPEMAA